MIEKYSFEAMLGCMIGVGIGNMIGIGPFLPLIQIMGHVVGNMLGSVVGL